MPVVVIAPNDSLLEKVKSNIQEVRARGGEMFVFADADSHFSDSDGVHVIRTPRHVDVSASGAVFGSVGRGATTVDLGVAGCGNWNVANTDGPVSVSIGGSGGVRAGTSTALDISIGGSGSVTAGATRALDIAIGGSGDVAVARIDGPLDVSIAGSGDVVIRDGTSPDVGVSIAGSGDVNFGGVAGDVDVSIAGGGDVSIARATGSVSRSIVGSGDIRIGS